jgi:molecular chaperone DnaK
MTLSIGIDLGTTNSVAAVATSTGEVVFARGPHGETIHPSVVAFRDSGAVIVGTEARQGRVSDPENTVYSAKRLIGQNIRAPLVQLALTSLPYLVEEGPNQQPIICVRDRRLTVPEVSAQVLAYLKRLTKGQFRDEVRDAVITVPANFSDAQRQATREAGRLAGLNVLRLINEPTAAALAYGYGQRLEEQVAVFDFGGGTFDISVLKIRAEIFEVLATDGDFFLGGDDIDQALAEFLAAEMNRSLSIDPRPFPQAMARLTMAAEEIKKHLSTEWSAAGSIDGLTAGDRPEPISLPFEITRQQFDNLITGYVDRTISVCRQVMLTARLDPRDISEVICVGGSTRIPLVRQRIAELFGKEPSLDINPDEVVAHGAAIQAATLSGHYADAGAQLATGEAAGSASAAAVPAASTRPLLLDVTPATLSIATAGGYTERLLEKNAPIPIERTKVFTTARDSQTRVVIECCRGESKRFEENERLGTLVLDNLPQSSRGELQIEVTFRVDTDGILHVRARDKKTGQKQEVTLNVLGAPVASAQMGLASHGSEGL